MFKNIIKTIFVKTFYELENQKVADTDLDKKVIVIFFTTIFSLIFIKYFGSIKFLSSFLRSINLDDLAISVRALNSYFPNKRLFELTYWVCILNFFYFIVPLFVIKVFLKDKVTNYGLYTKSLLNDYKIYVFFFVLLFPLILFASTRESFQHAYPFYQSYRFRESLWPNFVFWQCLYLSQFFTLEFFYRGFLIHGIKKRFGFYSIFVMMIPYVMIHFQKPLPETLGAILAAIVLGTLSLKSRSIWLGVAIHYSVAITMDLAALWQKGYFG